MTIQINQTPVDFQLEGETTVNDLLRSIRTWAETEGQTLLSVLADGRDAGEQGQRPLDGVSQIDVETVDASQGRSAQGQVLTEYLALIAGAAERADPQWRSELARDWEPVAAAIRTLFPETEQRWGPELEAVSRGLGDGSVPAVSLRRLADSLQALHRERVTPDVALSESLRDLGLALAAVPDLGRHFQQGNDRDALDAILDLFTVLDDLDRRTRLTGHPQVGEAWTTLRRDLAPFLTEARQALDSADYVLLTDLLEYEVLPRLSGVGRLVPPGGSS